MAKSWVDAKLTSTAITVLDIGTNNSVSVTMQQNVAQMINISGFAADIKTDPDFTFDPLTGKGTYIGASTPVIVSIFYSVTKNAPNITQSLYTWVAMNVSTVSPNRRLKEDFIALLQTNSINDPRSIFRTFTLNKNDTFQLAALYTISGTVNVGIVVTKQIILFIYFRKKIKKITLLVQNQHYFVLSFCYLIFDLDVSGLFFSRIVMVSECPICLREYNETSRIPCVLVCGHTFCKLCLLQLQVKPCNACRRCVFCNAKFKNFAPNFALMSLTKELETSLNNNNNKSINRTNRLTSCTSSLNHIEQNSNIHLPVAMIPNNRSSANTKKDIAVTMFHFTIMLIVIALIIILCIENDLKFLLMFFKVMGTSGVSLIVLQAYYAYDAFQILMLLFLISQLLLAIFTLFLFYSLSKHIYYLQIIEWCNYLVAFRICQTRMLD